MECGISFTLNPCVPDAWPSFKATWKKPGGQAICKITVNNPSLRAGHIVSADVDGKTLPVSGRMARIPFALAYLRIATSSKTH
jgi:hypothetical protein